MKSIADNLEPLIQGDDSLFMNRISSSHTNNDKHNAANKAENSAAKKQSHIRQARPQKSKELPASGPMADMLKKLFKKD